MVELSNNGSIVELTRIELIVELRLIVELFNTETIDELGHLYFGRFKIEIVGPKKATVAP